MLCGLGVDLGVWFAKSGTAGDCAKELKSFTDR